MIKLNKNIKIDTNKGVNIIPRFKDLYYCNATNTDSSYINATEFYKTLNNKTEQELNMSCTELLNLFLSQYKMFIKPMAEMYEVELNSLFVYTNGEIWFDSILDTIFLWFCFPELITETADWSRSMLKYNFAVHDSVLQSLASSNLPTESLKLILKNRNNE